MTRIIYSYIRASLVISVAVYSVIKQQIQSDASLALKQNKREIVGVLRMALNSINLKEKEKRSELTDEEVIPILSSEIKKRKDAINLYEQGNRQELAEKERKEIEIIKKYLPEQLSEDKIKKLVQKSIAKVGAKEIRDIGKVMADLSPKIKGKADGGEVSKIVKELLSK